MFLSSCLSLDVMVIFMITYILRLLYFTFRILYLPSGFYIIFIKVACFHLFIILLTFTRPIVCFNRHMAYCMAIAPCIYKLHHSNDTCTPPDQHNMTGICSVVIKLLESGLIKEKDREPSVRIT